MTTTYTLLTTHTTFTEVLNSADGPARFAAIGGDIEWYVGTSAPVIAANGIPLKGTVYSPDSAVKRNGDMLEIEYALVTGARLYMKAAERTTVVVRTTDAEMFGG